MLRRPPPPANGHASAWSTATVRSVPRATAARGWTSHPRERARCGTAAGSTEATKISGADITAASSPCPLPCIRRLGPARRFQFRTYARRHSSCRHCSCSCSRRSSDHLIGTSLPILRQRPLLLLLLKHLVEAEVGRTAVEVWSSHGWRHDGGDADTARRTSRKK